MPRRPSKIKQKMSICKKIKKIPAQRSRSPQNTKDYFSPASSSPQPVDLFCPFWCHTRDCFSKNEALRSTLLWIQSERHLPSFLPSFLPSSRPPAVAANQSDGHACHRAAILFAWHLTYISIFLACVSPSWRAEREKEKGKKTNEEQLFVPGASELA